VVRPGRRRAGGGVGGRAELPDGARRAAHVRRAPPGSAPKLGARARRRAEAVLREVGLLDERGRALRADAVDPHASATLVAGLVQRYRLETLIHAYRHLDDDGFARTVATLYLSDDA